jgi:putative sterol carrier protein
MPSKYKPGTDLSGPMGSPPDSNRGLDRDERDHPVAVAENVIPAFFESLAGPHPAVPRTISGSLRFDLENGTRIEHWRLTFAKGVVAAARSNAAADCIARTNKATLESIIQGRVNMMAALLRGAIKVEGQVLLLSLFRGLLTTRAAKTESQRVGRNTGRRS